MPSKQEEAKQWLAERLARKANSWVKIDYAQELERNQNDLQTIVDAVTVTPRKEADSYLDDREPGAEWELKYNSPEEKKRLEIILSRFGSTLFDKNGYIVEDNLVESFSPRMVKYDGNENEGTIIIKNADQNSVIEGSLTTTRHMNDALATLKAARDPEWFKYDRLIAKDTAETFMPEGSGMMVKKSYQWIYIQNPVNVAPQNGSTQYKQQPIIGKFHISINEDDVAKVTDLIIPKLIEKHITTKFMTPEMQEASKEGKIYEDGKGKSLVFYFDSENIKDQSMWQELANDIEKTLAANNIKPGPNIVTDRKIDNSQYLYMRYGDTMYNDKGKGNKWDAAMKRVGIQEDLFKDLKITTGIAQASDITAHDITEGAIPLNAEPIAMVPPRETAAAISL